MTPQQKLVRLKEIYEALVDASLDARKALRGELNTLLADVHLPPRELMNVSDPQLWARHMAEALPPYGISEATAFAWLGRAMGAADQVGYSHGIIAGRQQAAQQMGEGRVALVAAVRLVLDLIDRRQMRPPLVRDAADPDNPPVSLREHLAGVLRSTGEDV